MSRPKKTPENSGLMPWPEVGRRVGLSAKQARLEAKEALKKLRQVFEDEGLDKDYLRDMVHTREREEALRDEALTALVSLDAE